MGQTRAIKKAIDNDKIKLECGIHTVEVKSNRFLGDSLSKKPYVNSFYLSHGTKFVLNPNRAYLKDKNEQYKLIRSKADYERAMYSIVAELGTSVEYSRIDICFDSEIPFEQMLSINRIFCFAFNKIVLPKNKNITTTLQFTGRVNSFKASRRNKSNELEIYDKKLESDGKWPYTRVEFRIIRQSGASLSVDDAVQAVALWLSNMKKKETYDKVITDYCRALSESVELCRNSTDNNLLNDFCSLHRLEIVNQKTFEAVYRGFGNTANVKDAKKYFFGYHSYCEDISYLLYKKYIEQFQRALTYFKKGTIIP